jgi:hypothetical protein
MIVNAELLMKVRKDNEHVLKRSVIGNPDTFMQWQVSLIQKAKQDKKKVNVRKHTSQAW